MPEFDTAQLRTVALLGHGGAGKTTLAEALLAAAGAIRAPGAVDRGTTVSDHDPLEKTWQHSLRTSIMHLERGGTRVHLLDTPGFPDFIGQSIEALDAVETAAVVVNAQLGIEMITNRMMQWAAERKLCRVLIVNKIDAENVDLPGAPCRAARGLRRRGAADQPPGRERHARGRLLLQSTRATRIFRPWPKRIAR